MTFSLEYYQLYKKDLLDISGQLSGQVKVLQLYSRLTAIKEINRQLENSSSRRIFTGEIYFY
ncbi:hypothetical protein P4686_18325 [Terribacillus saccharophilus]|nr:hypothetical protein [Terribacillus saccharophilus]